MERYTTNGQTTQGLVAARDLNSNSLPRASWVKQQVVYTPGYGAIVSPTNQATSSGDPVFTVKNIPPQTQGVSLTDHGAQLYFGLNQSGYTIVDAKQDEFNYATANNANNPTRYKGRDGVKRSNIVRKAAFALRFGDLNPLISGQVTGNSKVLMVRDVQSRVQKLAPFLQFDSNPYPVVVNGRITWILDGYTTSDQ